MKISSGTIWNRTSVLPICSILTAELPRSPSSEYSEQEKVKEANFHPCVITLIYPDFSETFMKSAKQWGSRNFEFANLVVHERRVTAFPVYWNTSRRNSANCSNAFVTCLAKQTQKKGPLTNADGSSAIKEAFSAFNGIPKFITAFKISGHLYFLGAMFQVSPSYLIILG